MSEGELFEAAWQAHRSGDTARAAELYRQVLGANPRHVDALYLLGAMAHQSGDFAAAAEYAARALAIAPQRAQLHNLRGSAQAALGDDGGAEASYRKAIAAEASAEAYNNLGILLKKQGRLEEAIAAYRGAVERDPAFADAWYNLGNAHRARDDLAAAEECMRRALAAEQDHAHALAALGQVLQRTERSAEALPFLERALTMTRGDAGLHCDVGDALQSLGRFDEAAARYREALAADGTLGRAWYSAARAETARGEHAAAAGLLRKAVEGSPGWAEALHNLGQSLFELGQTDEALECFRAAADRSQAALPRHSIAQIIPGSPKSGPQEILETRRDWAARFLPPARSRRSEGRRGGKLRIGYLSSFFHRPNWMKPVWGLINRHDRAEFEIHLFSDAREEEIGEGRIARTGDRCHYIGELDNGAAAEAIEREEIDVLIDLNGYSAMRRLPLIALHPARVVAAWFNMYATSGMSAYDYLLGDEHVAPPGDERFYVEKLVRLPGSYLAFSVDYAVPETAAPPCMGGGAMAYGCLAPQYKITPQAMAAWSRILREVPGSTLRLRNWALGSEGNREFVRARFAEHGIAAGRLRLGGPLKHFEFLQTYGEIDLALDTFPYNGGTTTTEALWQGVPVIAFAGDRWVARTSSSLLREAGLGEFVTAGVDAYTELAVRLGRDSQTPSRLAALRGGMRDRLRQAAVCDTAALARAMERFCRDVVS